MSNQTEIRKYSDTKLLQGLSRMGAKETESIAEILLHLGEVDSRKLYRQHGYGSLFDFCRRSSLRYSEGAAQRRITAARAIARFPQLLELFVVKELNLCTLSLAASVLSEDNYSEVVPAICGKSKREVEAYLAAYRPKKALAESIKPVCVAVGKKAAAESRSLFDKPQPTDIIHNSAATSGGRVSDLSDNGGCCAAQELEQKFELRCQLSSSVMKKYQEVQMLLSTKHPKGVGMEELFNEVFELYLEKHSPRRRQQRRDAKALRQKAAVKNFKSASPHIQAQGEATSACQGTDSTSRCIPRRIRDAVYIRDGGRCTFVSKHGRRCSCRHNLQIDHVVPFSRTADNSIDNLRLACAEHNTYFAELHFGKEYMSQYAGKQT